jgi:HAD superfamily hydrolase (TIGR01450 family)
MELTPGGAFLRYEALRPRLPAMPALSTRPPMAAASGLVELADHFDAFLFDAFGVLVLGDTPIAGAAGTVRWLKAMGKSVHLMTNSAALAQAAMADKYTAMGFPFSEREILSSRSVLVRALADFAHIRSWGAILPGRGSREGLPDALATLDDAPEAFWNAEGYLFLSGQRWTGDLQGRLVERLRRRPDPVLIGNPDIVAPRETGFSLQPGYYGHDLLDKVDCEVRFYGKPYGNAFEVAIKAIEAARGPTDRTRIAMIGDTLHTDILGGAAAGLRTILVTGHGVLKDHEPVAAIDASGIRPDYTIPTL